MARRALHAPGAEVPPLSDEVAAKLAELNIDFEKSGLKYLPNEARVRPPGAADATVGLLAHRPSLPASWQNSLCRTPCGHLPTRQEALSSAPLPPLIPQLRALDRKSAKFEKTKNEKCGSHMWNDVTELAALIRWAASKG